MKRWMYVSVAAGLIALGIGCSLDDASRGSESEESETPFESYAASSCAANQTQVTCYSTGVESTRCATGASGGAAFSCFGQNNFDYGMIRSGNTLYYGRNQPCQNSAGSSCAGKSAGQSCGNGSYCSNFGAGGATSSCFCLQ